MRIALAGFGAWGQMIAKALAAIEGTQIVGVYCHGHGSESAAREQLPQALRSSDYGEMLKSLSPDVVCVAVPNHRHAEFALGALRHGAHVFLEKPLGLSLEECDSVIQVSRQSGRLVAVDHEFRISHQWGTQRDLIEKGEIGRLRFQRFILFRRPFRLGSGSWRHDPTKVGSWILEEVVHFIDLALWYARENGKPARLRASGTGARASEGLFDSLTIELFWKDGSSALISQCLAGFEHHLVVELTGTQGAIRSWWSGAMDRSLTPNFEVKLRRQGENPMEAAKILPIPHSGEVIELEENLRLALAGFRSGRSILPPEEARDSIAICLTAAQAALNGKEVPLGEGDRKG